MRRRITRKNLRSRRTRKKKVPAFIYFFGSLLVLFIVVSVVSRMDRFTFGEIKVTGVNLVSNIDVFNLVNEHLQNKTFFFISENNKFFADKSRIESDLYSTFPEIKKVVIDADGFNILNVNIEERAPIALWCDGEPGMEVDGCAFIDDTSFAYTSSPEFSRGAYVTYYKTTGELLGQSLFEEEYFNELSIFLRSVIQIPLHIDGLYVKDGEVFELLLSSESGDDYARIVFRRETPFSEVFENLSLLLNESGLNALYSRGYLPGLEYVDLRFGNKVFYKTAQ